LKLSLGSATLIANILVREFTWGDQKVLLLT